MVNEINNIKNNNDLYWLNLEPIKLIDEVSETEIYTGISKQGNKKDKAVWQIKKMLKTGTVWNTSLFPNGNQGFDFVWDDRATYTYE